jgi:PAS domain S-box-containing protein
LKTPEADILGKTDFELMPVELAKGCQSTDKQVLDSSKATIFTEFLGDRIYDSHKFPVRLKDGKTGVGAFIRDVTEQIHVKQELLKLSRVVEQSPESIVVTDTNGIIEYVNPASCNTSGYTVEELVGENPRVLKSGETPSEEYKVIWETITAGYEWKGDFHNRKKNGELYWEHATISPLKNPKGEITHFLGIKEDITEQKHSEGLQKVVFNISKHTQETGELKQLFVYIKDELNQLFDTTNFYVAFYDEGSDMLNAVYVSDENDIITEWPAEKSLTGYVIKNNKSVLFKHDDFDKLVETGDLELIGVDSEIWLGVPLTVNGKPYGAIVIQDYHNPDAYSENDLKMLEFIASQVSLSIQRQKSILELQDAFAKAEAGDKLKTAFINNISHEIRTPLNGILGFTEMTLNPDSTREDNELFFSIIKKSSKRLLNTITSYMDISMLVSGTMELVRRPSNLDKLIKEVYKDFAEMSINKGIELQIRKPQFEDPMILNTDIEKLRKIMSHLLDNAFKFTQKGLITFGYELKENDFEFFVSDTGTGIKTETMSVIFDAFMQADVSSTRGYEGSGLGLSIANGLVKLLGGNLWVDTERGRGSTFYFTIPFTANPILNIRKSIEPPKIQPSAKPLILIAEDDDSNYKYIEIVLLYASYNVIRAENGMEAVECCRNNPDVRLVLMDIKMPLMDGFEATRQIRKFMPGLPVIALTAHVTTEDENMAVASGCNEYVTKPVSKAKLLEIIEESLALN